MVSITIQYSVQGTVFRQSKDSLKEVLHVGLGLGLHWHGGLGLDSLQLAWSWTWKTWEIWDQTIIYAGLKKYKLAPVTVLSPLAVHRWIAQWWSGKLKTSTKELTRGGQDPWNNLFDQLFNLSCPKHRVQSQSTLDLRLSVQICLCLDQSTCLKTSSTVVTKKGNRD